MTKSLTTFFQGMSLLLPLLANHARADLPELIAQPFGITGGTGTVTYDLFSADPSARYVVGSTSDDDSNRIWGVDTDTGRLSQIGLYGDGVYAGNASISGVTSNTAGLVVGIALRADGELISSTLLGFLGANSYSSWVSDLNTGVTHEIGLYDSAHQLPNAQLEATGPAYFNLGIQATNSGHALGLALNNTNGADLDYMLFDANGGGLLFLSPDYGQSVWMAEASTGVTTRFGLTDAEHTMSAVVDGGGATLAGGGYQGSTIAEGGISEAGKLAGMSLQFGDVIDEHLGDGPKAHAGISLWVGDANNGKTYQVGLTDAGHTSATGTRDAFFIPIEQDGSQTFDAPPGLVTSEGFVAGNSANYPAGSDPGSSAWVATYDSGSDAYVTTRLGFFGGEADGRYQDANGMEWSEVTHFTQTGLVGGFSTMLDNSDYEDTMQSAWVVDAHDLIRVEVGLLDTAYTLGDGYHQTTIGFLTNAGLVAGESTLFGAALDRSDDERVTWVQKVASSIDGTSMSAERIGLTTLSDSTARKSYIEGVTQSGIVNGWTRQILAAGGGTATDTWVAYLDGAHFATDQVGLTGADYTHPDTGARYSEVKDMLESGVALGITKRYYTPDAGTTHSTTNATWIATRQPTASYVTTRVGLFDAFHTGTDGRQSSSFVSYARTNSGYVGGYSTNYGTAGATGQSAWVVDAGDAITRQVGATDLRHTAADGTQHSDIYGITESGFAWGESYRYTDDGLTDNGQTAWVYAFSDHSLHLLEISVNLLTGYADSQIYAVTEGGLAYGSFEKFNATTGASEGFRAFGWTLADGVFVLDDLVINDLSSFDWGSLADLFIVASNGAFIGSTENGQLFIAAIPEPGAYAGLAGVAVLGFVMVRRRRKAS